MVITCIICHKSYKFPQSLRRHIRSHDAETRRLTCPSCLSHFGRLDNFRRHTARKHPGEIINPVLFNPRAVAKHPIIDRVWEVTGVKKIKANNSTFTTRIWQGKIDPTNKKNTEIYRPTSCHTMRDTEQSSSAETICFDEADLNKTEDDTHIDNLISKQIMIIKNLMDKFHRENILTEDLFISESDSD